ncbi:MAG: hypothetical protein J6D37_07075 [Clostridia bacterium]|nr:hypothetical protein [Clostridia bacterium]
MKKVKVALASICLALCTFFLVACGGIAGTYRNTISGTVLTPETTCTLEIKRDGKFTYSVQTEGSTTTVTGTWTQDEENENIYILKADGSSLIGNGKLEVKDDETVLFNGREFKK